VAGQEDVVGLQVSVDPPILVQVADGHADLHEPLHHLVLGKHLRWEGSEKHNSITSGKVTIALVTSGTGKENAAKSSPPRDPRHQQGIAPVASEGQEAL
jgi:hypothetical protein